MWKTLKVSSTLNRINLSWSCTAQRLTESAGTIQLHKCLAGRQNSDCSQSDADTVQVFRQPWLLACQYTIDGSVSSMDWRIECYCLFSLQGWARELLMCTAKALCTLAENHPKSASSAGTGQRSASVSMSVLQKPFSQALDLKLVHPRCVESALTKGHLNNCFLCALITLNKCSGVHCIKM